MSKYIITGACGFIGSHLTEELVNRGHDIIAIDNLCSGRIENISHLLGKIDFYERDILNLDWLFQQGYFDKVDGIFHLAALRSVPKSFEMPYDYHRVNIDGTLYLLQKCKEYNIPKFINTSSGSVYGNVSKFPQIEGQENNCICTYALTKKAGEMYCKMFSELYGIHTCSLRYFNVFGERQNLDDSYSAVIPKFIFNILDNKPVPIYGTGEQSRDFTYVKNVVYANILAMESKNKLKGEEFNVGTGNTVKIIDLFFKIADYLNVNARTQSLPARLGDVFKSQASLEKINKYLNYNPKYSFDEGLIRTINWWKKENKNEK